MSEVVVIGSASLNTVVTLGALPEPRPHTVTALGHRRALGGTTAGKALHLAALGVATTCITTVGADADGAEVVESLQAPGLDLWAFRGAGPTEHHLNVMTPHGERLSIFLDHAPRPLLTEDQRARVTAAIASASDVFFDLSQLGLAFEQEIVPSEATIWVDLHDYDGVQEFHRPFLAAADVVLMNGDAMDDPVPFLTQCVQEGRRAAVCTLGARGAVGVAGDGTVARVPAVPTEVVDTNGAGDAFAAGMCAHARRGGPDSLATGESLAAAMAAGARQSVFALRSRGVGPIGQ